MWVWDKGAWVLPSLPGPALSLRRHCSYTVRLGQEPSLRSTFPRVGGAREGSPITTEHGWPWAALGDLGWGLFPQALALLALQIMLIPRVGGRAQMVISQPPAPQQPGVYFWIWGVFGFVFEIPVQKEFVFIA